MGFLPDDVGLVFWEGRSDFHRIAFQVLIHPTPGDHSFLLAHGVQQTKFVQALTCSSTSGIRRCDDKRYDMPVYPDGTEAVFASDAVASDYTFDPTNAAVMTAVTE